MTDQLLSIMGKNGAFFFQTIGSSVPHLDAAGFSRLFFARDGIARAWSQFMADYGLILSPTWTQLTFEEGFDVASEDNVAATMEMIRPVVPANLIGLPSACVPAGQDPATGLPIGVLLTGGACATWNAWTPQRRSKRASASRLQSIRNRPSASHRERRHAEQPEMQAADQQRINDQPDDDGAGRGAELWLRIDDAVPPVAGV